MTQFSMKWLEKEVLPYFFYDVNKIQCSENNYAALFYHHLLTSGLSFNQVCREMYIEDTKKRPDIAVFSKELNGRFSLYQNGDKDNSNTALKFKCIDALIEMKGACHGEKQSLDKFYELVKDIEKLKYWRSFFNGKGDYIFLAINLSWLSKSILREKIEELATKSFEANISFVYFSQGNSSFDLWQAGDLTCRKNEIINRRID